MHSIHLLLVESDPEEAAFLMDALTEAEERRLWQTWREAEVVHAADLTEAVELLRAGTFDAVLLNLRLPGTPASQTFPLVSQAAPGVPIIVVASAADEAHAARLVREGVADYIVKEEVDCGPLVRTIRNAIERNRILLAARSAAVVDPLTGLLNQAGFTAFFEHDRWLAEELGLRLLLLLAEPDRAMAMEGSYGGVQHDLALIDFADRLRTSLGERTIVARLGDRQFSLLAVETSPGSLERMRDRFQDKMALQQVASGAAIFNPAQPVSMDALLSEAAADLARSAVRQ